MSRQKLSLDQVKDLVSALEARYTKTEIDAIIDAVETKWDGDLSQLNTLVVAEVSALKTRMLSAENRLDGLDNDVASLVAADSAESTARVAGDAANAAAISAEETRATAAEQAIAADLAQEITDRQSALTALEGTFSTAVDALEAKDAEIVAAVQEVETNLETESTARVAGDANLQSQIDALSASSGADLTALTGRVTTAEGEIDALQIAVADEATLRASGDTNLDNKINAEITRATGVESQLDSEITAVENRATALEGRATAIETKNTEQDSRLTAVEGEVDVLQSDLAEVETALLSEVARATSAEGALDVRVSALEGVDGVYDSRMTTIEGSVAAEAAARAAADTMLQSNIDNTNVELNFEQNQRIAGDVNLQNQIDALSSQSGADLTALTARVTTAEGEIDTLQSDLAAEIARATGVEGSLANLNLQDNNGDPLSPANLVDAINMVNSTGSVAVAGVEAALAQEVADRIADVDAEEARAIAKENEIVAAVQAVETDIETNYMKKSGIVQQSFVATAGQTVFTLTEPVATVFIAMVMVNGVQYLMGSDFTLSGSTLTFNFGLTAGDEVQATYFNK